MTFILNQSLLGYSVFGDFIPTVEGEILGPDAIMGDSSYPSEDYPGGFMPSETPTPVYITISAEVN